MNKYLINKFDSWLANLPKSYYNYLNPLEFVEETSVNTELALRLFANSASEKNFNEKGLTPLLKVKYVVDCPDCNENVTTYYNRQDIPEFEIECKEHTCDEFIPINHPEKINIYFELLDTPQLLDDSELDIYKKKSAPPLTLNIYDAIWENEENKLNE